MLLEFVCSIASFPAQHALRINLKFASLASNLPSSVEVLALWTLPATAMPVVLTVDKGSATSCMNPHVTLAAQLQKYLIACSVVNLNSNFVPFAKMDITSTQQVLVLHALMPARHALALPFAPPVLLPTLFLSELKDSASLASLLVLPAQVTRHTAKLVSMVSQKKVGNVKTTHLSALL